MSAIRWLTLTAGPVGLVAASWWLAMPETVRGVASAQANAAGRSAAHSSSTGLDQACRRAAQRLAGRLGRELGVVTRPPFVLAGDLPEEQLAGYHQRLIVPVAGWLAREYFDGTPGEPIVVVLCSGEPSYRRFAQVLDGRTSPLWYGYYQRDERRIVVDVSTGDGTLVHELVHALAHFDCPGLPEWFDEGLASLYEQCRFSDDGLRIEGVSNWRLGSLRQALERDGLQPLSALTTPHGIRRDREAVDYAHARYLCLYLQDRRLLGAYYRRLRANLARDPRGLRTLCQVLNAPSPEAIDGDFRRWLLALR